MDYKKIPIFKGISSEIEAYLDRFDSLLKKNNLNLPPEEILVRKMSLFASYIDSKNREDFSTRIEKNLQLQASENGGISLFFLEGSIYGIRRNVYNKQKMNDLEYHNLIEKWKAKKNGLNVSLGNDGSPSGWVYKTSPNYNSKDLHRFILNVDPNLNLLEELDKFALKYNCQYKCAETQRIAYSRPDTILIYTSDKRIEEQKTVLSALVKPYVRANGDNFLDGEKIEEGLHYAIEKNRADIQKLIDESKSVYPRLGKYLESILNNTRKNHPLSLGQFTVYKDILDSIIILKNQNVKVNLNKNKTYNIRSVLEEGIKILFNKTADLNTSLEEIKNTEQVSFSVNSKNPNILNIEGIDKNKNRTFSMQYDKETGVYLYQGGKPEKIYSNNPLLNFPPLPEAVLRQIKNNQKKSIDKALVKAEMKNGVKIIEGDSVVSIRQEKVGEHKNSLVFKKKRKDGTLVSEFVIDRDTGEYIGRDYETGKKFINSAKHFDKNLSKLPPEVIERYQKRIKQAEQAIINSKMNLDLINKHGRQ